MNESRPNTVVETPEFLSAATRLMDDEERSLLVDYLSANPAAGDLLPSTGGLRKLRWGLDGRGKRGGARVIYYFHDSGMPIFALSAYTKNAKANISEVDKNIYKTLIRTLVDSYASKRSLK